MLLRRDRLVAALLVSSFTHLAMLLIVSPTPGFRYIHGLIVVALYAVAVRLFAPKTAIQ